MGVDLQLLSIDHELCRQFSNGFPKLFRLFLLPKCILSLADVFPALLDFIGQHGHIGMQSLLLMLGWLRG